ncbi:MAG: mannose-1-phosphate guanylyltransferase, partial [Leptospira sp.]|nr:mannose-1-phosphate guanylyltransferase [Leptospira sp.]
FGFQVKGFFEKPDLKTAAKYIKKENFFWNPGIFIWKTETILSEFSKYAPYILNPLKSAFPFKNPGELGQVFKLIPSEAIDTAIMEKSNLIRMVRAGFKWDDVGSWLSLARVLPGDNQGNHHIGKGVYYYKSKNNISVTGKEMVTFLGVEDLIVVEEEDVLFISTRSKVGEIKTFLGELRKNRSLQKYLE